MAQISLNSRLSTEVISSPFCTQKVYYCVHKGLIHILTLYSFKIQFSYTIFYP
jgi:hypothetical protein